MSVPSLVPEINRRSLECIQCWTEQNVVYTSPPKTHCRSGNIALQQLWGKFTHQVPTSLMGTFKTRTYKNIHFYVLQRKKKKKSHKIYTHTHIQNQDAPKPGLNLLSLKGEIWIPIMAKSFLVDSPLILFPTFYLLFLQ